MRGGVSEGFDFAKRLTEPVFTHFSGSKLRLGASCSIAPKNAADMMAALRTHDPRVAAKLFPKGSVRSVCMHAGGAIGDHTTGSLVAQLRRGQPMTLWITGASTPCMAAFKPVFFGVDSGHGVRGRDGCQAVLAGAGGGAPRRAGRTDGRESAGVKRDTLETDWLAAERKLMAEGADSEKLRELAVRAANEEQAMIDTVRPQSVSPAPTPYWRKKNAALEKA